MSAVQPKHWREIIKEAVNDRYSERMQEARTEIERQKLREEKQQMLNYVSAEVIMKTVLELKGD